MPQTRRAKQAGNAALDRLRASIEAAENALKDLQGEVSRDSRDLLKDIGKTLKATQRNFTRSRKRIAKDIEHLEHALVKGKAPARTGAKGAAASTRASASGKTARSKRTTKRTTTKRTAATRTTAKRPAAKRTTAKRPAAKRTTAKRPAKRTAAKAAAAR
jgi:hypothetical protein